MKTLQELNQLQENDDLASWIEYADWCELDNEFIEMEIINPENEQRLIYAWVPANMEQQLEDEKELAETNSYYDWTSTWTSFCQKYWEDEIYEEDLQKLKKEIVENWNNTELGSKYPINEDNVDADFWNTNKIFFTKEFNIF